MALGDLTRQIAQQALISATSTPKESAGPAPVEHPGATIVAQISAMQRTLKEDEELVVLFLSGGEKIRVLELFMPSWRVAVLSGVDAHRNPVRVISPVEALQLVTKVAKAQPGARPIRVGLITPKPKEPRP